MKFEPQCKTRPEMLREAARVIEMCDGTGICPYYKYKDKEFDIIDTLEACDTPEGCEFPIAIVEGKLVWRGDELYYGSRKYVATGGENRLVWLVGDSTGGSANPDELSWNPPRKTITINGKEFAAPHENGAWVMDLDINRYGWDKKEDADAVEAEIIKALESRPPKM